jgi:hypothetical protein
VKVWVRIEALFLIIAPQVLMLLKVEPVMTTLPR